MSLIWHPPPFDAPTSPILLVHRWKNAHEVLCTGGNFPGASHTVNRRYPGTHSFWHLLGTLRNAGFPQRAPGAPRAGSVELLFAVTVAREQHWRSREQRWLAGWLAGPRCRWPETPVSPVTVSGSLPDTVTGKSEDSGHLHRAARPPGGAGCGGSRGPGVALKAGGGGSE